MFHVTVHVIRLYNVSKYLKYINCAQCSHKLNNNMLKTVHTVRTVESYFLLDCKFIFCLLACTRKRSELETNIYHFRRSLQLKVFTKASDALFVGRVRFYNRLKYLQS